jgi:hypothetical protein
MSKARTIEGIARALLTAALFAPAGALSAQNTDPCTGQSHCAAVTSFVATVSDFRNSTSGRTRIITATVRFLNRTNHPLILGYVQNSGIATDDQGNRYVVYGSNSVRGIGEITSSRFDPKFTLQPGETSDARFELVWSPSRNEIFGTRFELEFAVREIDPLAGNQYRLGREHALRFTGFSDATIAEAAGAASSPSGSGATTPPQATGSSAATTQAATQVAPAADAANGSASACGATPHCYDAGAFTAQVARFTGSRLGNNTGDHMLDVVLRVRNVSSQPIVLAYKATSGSIIDNLGNRYYWGRAGTHDNSASGIGVVTGRSADPQFALAPGESRDATFKLRRYGTGRNALGTAFAYSLALEQLEILPGNQIRSLREYSVSFDELAEGSSAAATPAVDDAVGKLGQKLIDKLRGKKKP